jgi:hypothetical protein
MILFFALTSCEDMFTGTVLEIDLPEHESKLAPYAFFKDSDSILTVMVGRSVGILDSTDPTVVDGATVELYKNGSLFQTFHYVDSVRGYQTVLAQQFSKNQWGDTYELRVSAPNHEAVSATQIMPQPVAISNTEYIPQGTVNQFGDPMDVVKLTFNDPANIKNFYEVVGVINYKYRDFWDTTIVYEYNYEVYFESSDPNYDEGTVTDVSFDGQTYTLSLQTYSFGFGSQEDLSFYIELRSVTEDYGRFKQSLNTYDRTQGNPFSEPVLVHTNMNSGMGLFGLLSTSRVKLL